MKSDQALREHPPLSLRVSSAFASALCLLISVLPVAAVLWVSVRSEGRFSLAAWSAILCERREWQLFANSVAIAGGTAALAALLGATLGLTLDYVRIPWRKALAPLAAVPFLIPSYVSAVAWIDLLGRNGLLTILADGLTGSPTPPAFNPYNIAGVILVQALSLYPLVTLTTCLAIRRIDQRMEDAAFLAVGPRAFWSITLPLLAPGILSGALFAFLMALVSFAVPSLMQVSVYPVEIYTRFNAFYDLPGAATRAMPLLLCGLAAISAWQLLVMPKYTRLARVPQEANPSLPRPRSLRLLALAYSIALLFVSVVLPLAILVRRALPLSSFAQAWRSAQAEILSSILVASCSASILVALGFAMAYFARSLRSRTRLHSLAILPFLISGPVLGVGLIAGWNHSGPFSAIYDSIAILLLACAARYLFFVRHALSMALREFHTRWEEAATLAAIPWWRQAASLFVPCAAPALCAAWGLAFVLCLGELDAVVLVCPPGFTTLSVRLFTLMHYGPDRLVAALSLIMVCLILSAAALAAVASSRARKALNARS